MFKATLPTESSQLARLLFDYRESASNILPCGVQFKYIYISVSIVSKRSFGIDFALLVLAQVC